MARSDLQFFSKNEIDRNLGNIAEGVAGRLRSLVVVLDRLDRLESGSGEWLAGFAEGELPEAAAAMTLRALQTAADPANFAILKALSAGESSKIGDLMEETGYGRLPLTERLNDLVQVGMASRLIDTDHAQITAAGAAMSALIEQLVGQVMEQYLQKSAGR
jgi:DNA-binding HxlR family transcriptional regulator